MKTIFCLYIFNDEGGNEMFDLISKNFVGANITLGITGLPVTVTGEVFEAVDNTIGIRQSGGNKIYVDVRKIAFFY